MFIAVSGGQGEILIRKSQSRAHAVHWRQERHMNFGHPVSPRSTRNFLRYWRTDKDELITQSGRKKETHDKNKLKNVEYIQRLKTRTHIKSQWYKRTR